MPRSGRGMTPIELAAVVSTGTNQKETRTRKKQCEAANAVEALDPGVPYESRWAPYVRAHGPGQGQFPKGSIRPRGLWLLTRVAASLGQSNNDADESPAR